MTTPPMTLSLRRPRRRLLSPITLRILGVNLMAIAILVAGLLYLDTYRRGLIEAETNNLLVQAEMVATALGEGGTSLDDADDQRIEADKISPIVRRLARTMDARVRLFAPDGAMIVDSRLLLGPGGVVQVETLPPPVLETGLMDRIAGGLIDAYVWIADWLPERERYPPYLESAIQTAEDYPEVVDALSGEDGRMVRELGKDQMIITVAVPVQRYKRVLGGVLLSRDSRNIDAAIYEVRVGIIAIFGVSLLVTILLSLYLSAAIARPLLRLSAAADQVAHGHHRQYAIPDFGARGDEIGDLSRSLRDMTEALWQRMDAIEGFAADVAHEIKNPLTSLRSAIETLERVKDPEHQRRLMGIVLDDVQRMNVLISGISDASRLDAELSRMDEKPFDVVPLLETLVDMHETTATPDMPRLVLEPIAGRPLIVSGMEERLVQVLRNLIANAVSFSPPGAAIALGAARDGGTILIRVEDRGPGIPAGKEEDIFKRFYSERPAGEKFGTHSGLGLSISRQIVEAHGGTIKAENLYSPDGNVRGCRFTIRLPAA